MTVLPARWRWPINLFLLAAVIGSARFGMPYPFDVVYVALGTRFED